MLPVTIKPEQEKAADMKISGIRSPARVIAKKDKLNDYYGKEPRANHMKGQHDEPATIITSGHDL
jgi:hypothetical protein